MYHHPRDSICVGPFYSGVTPVAQCNNCLERTKYTVRGTGNPAAKPCNGREKLLTMGDSRGGVRAIAELRKA